MGRGSSDGLAAFKLLACRVEIRHQDPALTDTFRYLAENATQPAPVRKVLRYRIEGFGPYRITEEDDLLDVVATPEDVLHIVYGRVYRRTLERFVLSGWAVLHGAVATVGDCRILFLGDKGAGKTTLCVRLLYAGHRVEGDEMALERGGAVLALPRLLHLKPGYQAQLPELQRMSAELPTKSTGDARVTGLDPTALGFDWQITVCPVDAVIWLTPNHGGETELRPRPPFEIIQRVLASSLGWGEMRDVLVATAARLGRSGGYELKLGDAHDATRRLEREFIRRS